MSDPISLAQGSPGKYLGPLILGPVFQVLLQGFILDLGWKYSRRASKENKIIVAIVCFLNVMALFQTCAAIYDLWTTFVMGFGNWSAALSFSWVQKIQTAYQASMAFPVQAYFIWRCWKVTSKNMFVLIGLGSLLASSWAVAVNTTYRVFQVNFTPAPATTSTIATLGKREFVIPVDGIFVYWLVSAALLDAIITIILLTYLIRNKTKSSFQQMHTMIDKLIYTVWETALPPASCAIATAVIYLIMVHSQTHFVDLFFQQIMGKLYVISLLVTLNTRISMNKSMSTFEMKTNSQSNTWNHVRVDVHTIRDLEARGGTQSELASTQPVALRLDGDRHVAKQADRKSQDLASVDDELTDYASEHNSSRKPSYLP